MKRITSAITYKMISENGLLPRLENLVYDYLFHNGPMTCREMMEKMRREGSRVPWTSISPIFARLEMKGVIVSLPDRPCKETGNLAIEWETTDNLPVKYEKPVRIPCKSCNGKGYHTEQQAKLL